MDTVTEKQRLAKRVGDGLRMARIDAGLTQRQVANELGWSVQKYYAIENGGRKATSLADYVSICDVIKVPLWLIMGEERHPGDLDGEDLSVLGLSRRLRTRSLDKHASWVKVGKAFMEG